MDIANIRKEVAQASAGVGVDLLQVAPAEPTARVPYARKLDYIGFVGSAAVGDCVVELFVNQQSKGKYGISSTGKGIDKQKDLIPLNIYVPANGLIEAKMVTAAVTNPVVIQLEFDKPSGSGTGYSGRRRSYRRTGGRSTRRSAGSSGQY